MATLKLMETYTRLLVGKHSPQNKCFAANGDVLFLRPRAQLPLRPHLSHHFLSSRDQKARSRYGWVKQTEPFRLEEFVDRYLQGATLSDDELNAIRTMLQSISQLPVDTTVAATYSSRGIEEKTMELTVHRVFLYKTGE
jgi:hypothetical protein